MGIMTHFFITEDLFAQLTLNSQVMFQTCFLTSEKLSGVRHKILVLSGKGGVGKSTVTSHLARCLVAKDEEKNIGLLDIDVCGPSIPRVMGLEGEQVYIT